MTKMNCQTQPPNKTNENASTMRPAEGTPVLEAIIDAWEKACQVKNSIFLHMNGVVLVITPESTITDALIRYNRIAWMLEEQAKA